MPELRSIEVIIQGNRYVLTSDEEEQHVTAVAAMVDEALTHAAGGKVSFHVAVLTALNFASDLVKIRREHEDLKKDIDSRTQALIENIDEQLTSTGRL